MKTFQSCFLEWLLAFRKYFQSQGAFDGPWMETSSGWAELESCLSLLLYLGGWECSGAAAPGAVRTGDSWVSFLCGYRGPHLRQCKSRVVPRHPVNFSGWDHELWLLHPCCGTLGLPALNREAWAVYGLFSVKAGIWMKRKSQWYREVGEILSIIFFPASWKLLTDTACLSPC